MYAALVVGASPPMGESNPWIVVMRMCIYKIYIYIYIIYMHKNKCSTRLYIYIYIYVCVCV